MVQLTDEEKSLTHVLTFCLVVVCGLELNLATDSLREVPVGRGRKDRHEKAEDEEGEVDTEQSWAPNGAIRCSCTPASLQAPCVTTLSRLDVIIALLPFIFTQ